MNVMQIISTACGLWIIAFGVADARGGGKPGPTPPPPTYPAARYWHHVTGNGSANSATSRIYMQGGESGLQNGTKYLSDLWYFHVATGQWTLLLPSGRAWPQLGRGNGSITCGEGRCLLFGGTSGTKALNETWHFQEPSGTATTTAWTQVSCRNPGSCPSARYLHTTAFDAARHYHVVLGGFNSTDSTLGDTWTFDGTRWSLRQSNSTMPVRHWGSATFVPSHVSNGTIVAFDKVVAFGGNPYPNAPYPAALCDLWAWNGGTWEEISAPDPKPCLMGATMAWDTSVYSSPRLMVTGGYAEDGNGTSWKTDTWYFTFTGDHSGNWSRDSSSVCAPMEGARGAYHASSKKLVFFGGVDSAGYAYDPTLVCP